MAVDPQMFLFLFKSKYRRKCYFRSEIFCFIIVYSFVFHVVFSGNCTNVQCVNGECVNGTGCVCYDGWQGTSCQFCGGKVRLSDSHGTIHDGHSNYSIDSKCSWLVDAGGVANTSIRLHFEEFATECGWDYLYIFDGDSVHSPLLAVFSGLMYKEGYSIRRIPEVVAHSGSALLHFYSDVAYNMTGFNITYRLNSCPSRFSHVNCSGHGVCIDGICTCDAMYTGEGCDVAICPNNCTKENGVCNREKHRCDCKNGFKGDDCSHLATHGYWEVVLPKDFVPEGSASHSATVWRDSLYIIGGESYHRAKMIYLYDFNGNVWETPHMDSRSIPGPRYAHSSVLFGDKLYAYGGVTSHGAICNELWAFDVSAKTWENITVRGMPLQSAGHTANLVTGKKQERMVVIFGHSPVYGYLNTVQEYYFGTREWRTIEPRGYAVKGGFGHSSSWDPLTAMIYVYGGYSSESSSSLALSNKLFSYEPNAHMWRLLMPAPSARFLHTATFLSPGLMIVFGGNTHNDTAHSHGAKCYSSELLAYDVVCDSWAPLPMPVELRADLARFGHSAVTFEDSLYVYGGFDGQMLADMLKFTPGQCSMLATQSACLNTRIGVKCVWDWQESKCQPVSFVPKLPLFDSMYRNSREIDSMFSRCPEEGRSSKAAAIVNNSMLCAKLKDCVSCVQTSFKCIWCGTTCSYENEKCREKSNEAGSYLASSRPTANLDHCEDSVGPTCHQLHSCQACSSHPACNWDYEARCTVINNLTLHHREPHETVNTCSPSCASFSSCVNCTMEECIWCQNEARCVDKNSYTASFPYGQCREWTTHGSRCRAIVSGKSACSYYSTCGECRDDPACGWCDDGSGTGLGTCLPGGNVGPDMPDYSCPAEHWFFTYCPTCQCNGHSTCSNGTKVCNQPCANLTHGLHCEHCITGYYGNPVNGGKCVPCECNDQGTECHPDTGKCFCKTKGIIGDHCERCDTTNHYHGDPTNKGSCFYDLTIDYQFTFNLSKKEDRHFTQINFKNSPPKPDVDADFSITCSVMAKMNITIKTANNGEKPVLIGHNCSTFKSKFSKAEHNFGVEENITLTTFYVYVYDFHPPLWIQISFSQYPKLNLQQFFITFSTCFLLLLLVAAILWKIKQKYDMYRRRQRLFVEMEQMASRPFSQVLVEIELREPSDDDDGVGVGVASAASRKRKKASPSPIALEPCCGNRAAVLSLLVRLPTGGEAYTPHGQSAGLAIASALVTLGNPRKVSLDTTGKSDSKSKSRKSLSSQHPDSCI